MRNLVISLGGTRVNASRPRARREGVHAGLIPGQHGRESAGGSLSSVWAAQTLSQAIKGQAGGVPEESCDRSRLHKRFHFFSLTSSASATPGTRGSEPRH